MKKLFALIAAIATAIVGVAQAQTPINAVIPDGLPARLSIGGMTQFLDGVATNQELLVNGLISTILDYQHYDGLWDDHVQIDYPDMRYSSYDDYKAHMVSDVLAMRSYVLADPTYNGGDVGVNSTISVDDIDGPYINTYVGPISGLDSNKLYALQPRFVNAYLVVPVTNLVKLEIRVPDSSPPYSFIWSNGVATTSPDPSPFPKECTENLWITANGSPLNVGTNQVLLNPWYSMGTNATRITMSVATGQVTYTGLGDPIAPPVVRMTDRYHLLVASTRGANTTVESSPGPDGPWAVFTTLVNQTNDAVVEIPATSTPRQFFRAFSD